MFKNITLLLILGAFAAFNLDAQIATPSASPFNSFTQAVGLSEVTVEYSRPSKKGRSIFAADGLVPHGKIWRAGANQATKITFSDDVKVGGTDLAAGAYAMLITPDATSWAIHFFNHEGGNWGSYVEKTPAATITSTVNKIPMTIETFSIVPGDMTSTKLTVDILWDQNWVKFDVETEVDAKVMANIESVMAGPSANAYFQAATYYHENGKDLNKALTFINKATAGDDPKFWQVRRKALILADLGKKSDAIAAAKMSLELATKAGNDDYVKLNKDSIAKWSM